MIFRRITGSPVVVLALLPLCACAAGTANRKIYRADLAAGQIVATVTEPAPRAIPGGPASAAKNLPEPTPPSLKIHPRLIEQIGTQPEAIVPVVIAFKDRVEIPRFPSLDPGSHRTSAENRQALAEAESLVRRLKAERLPIYTEQIDLLTRRYKAQVTETFWLIDAVVADIPLRNVPELALRDDVLSITPVDSGEIPPADDGDPLNDVDKGRAVIFSDPYFGLGLTGGTIGLLDTGVRSTHRQLATPGLIASLRDCVNGDANCDDAGRGFDPDDDCWNHGTSSAAILAGNDSAGRTFRGVTGIALHSFKVYPTAFDKASPEKCIGTLDSRAAVRGFQAAVAALDKVIVAEMQGSGGELGCIALAANAAFDAGAVVVAANGNFFDPPEIVAEPANAARVLGVGNFDVISGDPIDGQRHGPTADGRIKPDFQTPTNSETASTGCGSRRDCRGRGTIDAFRVFGGTSGAVPYAGGAAALLRNLVLRVTKMRNVEPGVVYALMILSGQQPVFDDTSGVGKLRLPADGDGTLRWGSVLVNDGKTFEIPINFSVPQGLLDAALWWPEDGVAIRHNDIDLEIVDPMGVVQSKSLSQPSVFERARVQGSLQGLWKVRIQGTSVRSSPPQRVYFALFNRVTP